MSEDWVEEGTAFMGWAQYKGFYVILGPLYPSLDLQLQVAVEGRCCGDIWIQVRRGLPGVLLAP